MLEWISSPRSSSLQRRWEIQFSPLHIINSRHKYLILFLARPPGREFIFSPFHNSISMHIRWWRWKRKAPSWKAPIQTMHLLLSQNVFTSCGWESRLVGEGWFTGPRFLATAAELIMCYGVPFRHRLCHSLYLSLSLCETGVWVIEAHQGPLLDQVAAAMQRLAFFAVVVAVKMGGKARIRMGNRIVTGATSPFWVTRERLHFNPSKKIFTFPCVCVCVCLATAGTRTSGSEWVCGKLKSHCNVFGSGKRSKHSAKGKIVH